MSNLLLLVVTGISVGAYARLISCCTYLACICMPYLWVIAEAAQKDLRKRGVVMASKKSSRTAAEGLLAVAQTENKAVVVELNCETDFVARNDIFQCMVCVLFVAIVIIIRAHFSIFISTHASTNLLLDCYIIAYVIICLFLVTDQCMFYCRPYLWQGQL